MYCGTRASKADKDDWLLYLDFLYPRLWGEDPETSNRTCAPAMYVPTRCEAYPAVYSISRWRCAAGLWTLDSDKYCYLFFDWWISLSVARHPPLNAPSFSSPENTGFVEMNAHCNFTSPSFNTQLSPLDQAAVYNWSRRIPVFSLPQGSNNEEIVSILREGMQATVNQFPDLAGSCTQPPQPRNGEK